MREFNPAAMDDYIINGSWHKCVCGSHWSDSDGGPCHAECQDCEEVTDLDELDSDGRCPECHQEKCSVCKEDVKSNELKDGKCSYCIEEETQTVEG